MGCRSLRRGVRRLGSGGPTRMALGEEELFTRSRFSRSSLPSLDCNIVFRSGAFRVSHRRANRQRGAQQTFLVEAVLSHEKRNINRDTLLCSNINPGLPAV